jgi:NAD(P)-dependent dehydrogenase (short-subunit alcohol dehydrogenase family)
VSSPFLFNSKKPITSIVQFRFSLHAGTNGLGAESALHLAKHNAAHIYISGRNAKSAEKVIQRIQESGSSSEITFIECDLASLLSVKKTGETFVSQASRLDILLCNAGIMAQPPSLTTDGYEVQFGTNHLGHALLIKKLLPLLEKQGSDGGDPRIIILTSEGLMLHPSGGIIFDKLRTVQDDFFFGGPWRRYGQSKLANLLFARELARRYPSIISASIHPGVVSTGLVGNQKFLDRALIYSTSFGKLLKPEEGAYNQVWAATTAKGNIENGAFYEPVGKSAHYKLGKTAKDDQLAERLWEWTQEVLEEF